MRRELKLTLLVRATFSYFEKRSYINAVKCLQSKPSITPPSAAPGAKRRYDDFAATHINQTLIIHETVVQGRDQLKKKRLILKGKFLRVAQISCLYL